MSTRASGSTEFTLLAAFAVAAAALTGPLGCDDAPSDTAPAASGGASTGGASGGGGSGGGATATGGATDGGGEPVRVRVATFNASLFRDAAGELREELADPSAEQPRRVAEVIQRVRPDLLLVNEFDFDATGAAGARFRDNFLAVGQNGAEPIDYPHLWAPESNTGVHSGHDLNDDGEIVSTPGESGYGEDAFGFGQFEGQYGLLVLSRFPLDAEAARTFRLLTWAARPGADLPPGRDGTGSYYDDAELAVFRLSSKTHADLPVLVGDHTLHFLVSHPTPPSFDGPEDRNGRRNGDELRLWLDVLDGAAHVVDDAGTPGGLPAGASFVIAGDLNNDPMDGSNDGIDELLAHPRVVDPLPTSTGAVSASDRDGMANTTHAGDPAWDTADFSDGAVGNRRADYVLPSSDLTLHEAGVFWPAPGEEHADLADVSDHHLVWVDLTIGL